MASGNISFAIGGTVLTYQPSGIAEIYPDVVEHMTLSGSRVIVESGAGPIVEVLFGSQAARAETYAGLRNARSATGSVSISYLNAAGSSTTRTVYMPQVNYEQFLMTNAIQPLSIQFRTF